MLLDSDKAATVFRKVTQVREEIRQYCLDHTQVNMPVEEFQRAISRMYEIEIQKEEVPFEGVFLRGMMMRFEKIVKIYVKKNMERDWQKFVAVKELCHVLIDEKEDWSFDGASTINRLLYEYRTERDRIAHSTVQSETFAEIAAIELMYPFEDRETDRRGMNGDQANDGASISQIATRYGIPEVFVSRALSDEYHDMASGIWVSVRAG